jgi:hypothetical protein
MRPQAAHDRQRQTYGSGVADGTVVAPLQGKGLVNRTGIECSRRHSDDARSYFDLDFTLRFLGRGL